MSIVCFCPDVSTSGFFLIPFKNPDNNETGVSLVGTVVLLVEKNPDNNVKEAPQKNNSKKIEINLFGNKISSNFVHT